MKRYVQELANDAINRIELNRAMKAEAKNQIKNQIRHIVYLCKKGMTTDFEAVSTIVNLLPHSIERDD